LAIEHGVGVPGEQPLGGHKVLIGDLVVAGDDVHHKESSRVLGLDLGTDLAFVDLAPAPGYLFPGVSRIRHGSIFYPVMFPENSETVRHLPGSSLAISARPVAKALEEEADALREEERAERGREEDERMMLWRLETGLPEDLDALAPLQRRELYKSLDLMVVANRDKSLTLKWFVDVDLEVIRCQEEET
jgi:hypothetical protein